jgi:hypothetical protein
MLLLLVTFTLLNINCILNILYIAVCVVSFTGCILSSECMFLEDVTIVIYKPYIYVALMLLPLHRFMLQPCCYYY